jgi:hypothetical protein
VTKLLRTTGLSRGFEYGATPNLGHPPNEFLDSAEEIIRADVGPYSSYS